MANSQVKKPSLAVALNFEGNGAKIFTANDAEDLIRFINANKRLTRIKLSNASIGTEAAIAIAEAIRGQKYLQHVDMSDIFTGGLTAEVPRVMEAFANCLSTTGTLHTLILSDNPLGPDGATALALLVARNYNIKVLKLVNNGLGASGGKILADSIAKAAQAAKNNATIYGLEVFHAGRNSLEDTGAEALGCALQHVSTLQELHLPQNGIRKKGITALCRAMAANRNLSSLDLNDNTCTKTSAQALASTLPLLPSLVHLDLTDCLLKSAGAAAVLSALAQPQASSSLQTLRICGNDLRCDIGPHLLAVAKHNPRLRVVDLSSNNIRRADAEALRVKLCQMRPSIVVKAKYCTDETSNEMSGESDVSTDISSSGEEDTELNDLMASLTPVQQGRPAFKASTTPASSVFGPFTPSPESVQKGAKIPFSTPFFGQTTPTPFQTPANQSYTRAQSFFKSATADAAAPRPVAPFTPFAAAEVSAVRGEPMLQAQMKESKQITESKRRGKFVAVPCKTEKRDTAKAVEELIAALRSEDDLSHVKLSENSFGVEACMALAQALREHRLEVVDLSDIFTGRLLDEIPQCVTRFGEVFMNMNTLQELDFGDNAFSPAGASAVAPLISTNYNIRILRFVNNGLGIGGGKIIAEALLKANEKAKSEGNVYRLEGFYAGRNRLESEGATALANAFQQIGTLKAIHLHQNGIRSDGIAALAKAVAANRALESIDLNDNIFNVEGGLAMAAAVQGCAGLVAVDFGDCLMETEGAVAVCAALEHGHTALEKLNLAGNDIEREARDAILKMLANKDQLKLIDLSNNELGKRGYAAIRKYLESVGKADVLQEEEDDF